MHRGCYNGGYGEEGHQDIWRAVQGTPRISPSDASRSCQATRCICAHAAKLGARPQRPLQASSKTLPRKTQDHQINLKKPHKISHFNLASYATCGYDDGEVFYSLLWRLSMLPKEKQLDRMREMAPFFWSNTVQREECLLWAGDLNSAGYGCCPTPAGCNLSSLAHRTAWIITYGLIPDDKMVCHSCDRQSCVNPLHLYLGDDKINQRDRHARGRTRVWEHEPVRFMGWYIYVSIKGQHGFDYQIRSTQCSGYETSSYGYKGPRRALEMAKRRILFIERNRHIFPRLKKEFERLDSLIEYHI